MSRRGDYRELVTAILDHAPLAGDAEAVHRAAPYDAGRLGPFRHRSAWPAREGWSVRHPATCADRLRALRSGERHP